MRAALYEAFGEPLAIREVPDPIPAADGVVLRVEASGICRSDWLGWQGYDPDIRSMPHVPGHELAGIVTAVGGDVQKWKPGDRVTVPFCCGCGVCPQCQSGFSNICDHHFQPGFSAWGSFAESVSIHHADVNLVQLPEDLDFVTAAALGCRFITAFRAVVDQGRVSEGDWVAVHGCGGVGLSAIMIARAFGARVLGVDISRERLDFARSIGASELLNAGDAVDLVEAIRDRTESGAHLSIDALGSLDTFRNSVRSLRKRGRHVQVGLMVGEEREAPLPMDQVVANEIEILGSHGMPAHSYPRIFEMISEGRLEPARLIGKRVSLDQAGIELEAMEEFRGFGLTIIDRFHAEPR